MTEATTPRPVQSWRPWGEPDLVKYAEHMAPPEILPGDYVDPWIEEEMYDADDEPWARPRLVLREHLAEFSDGDDLYNEQAFNRLQEKEQAR